MQRTVLSRPFCSSVCLSVCLSVYLSVKRVDCDKTKETCASLCRTAQNVFWYLEHCFDVAHESVGQTHRQTDRTAVSNNNVRKKTPLTLIAAVGMQGPVRGGGRSVDGDVDVPRCWSYLVHGRRDAVPRSR